MKKILPLLMLCMFCMNFAKAQTETEPNNVWNQSNLITIGATGSGTAAVGYDEDWWRVATPGDGKLTINWASTTAGSNVFCQIYDTLGTILLISNYTSTASVESFDGLAKGTYYLRFVTVFSTETTAYSFTPTFTAAAVSNDAEPDSTVATALTLPLNGSVTGHIGYYFNNHRDTVDFYKVTVVQDGLLSFTITSENSQNVFAQLFDGDGTTYLVGNYTSSTVTYSKDGLAPGVYYILVHTFFNTEFVPYTLSNTFTAPPHANDPIANETPATASTLPLNGSVTGHIGYHYNGARDDIDWWKVNVNADGRIDFTITSDNSQNVFAQLYDGDGTTYLAGSYTSSTANYSKDGLAPGIYYIRVVTFYNTEWDSYTLTNTFTQPLQANDIGSNDIYTNGNVFALNSTTTGHIGYRYNGNIDATDWYKITTTEDGKISFTITSENIQNVYAQLFDGDGTSYLAGNYTSSTANYSKDGLAAGTYYLRIVTFYVTEFAPYTLSNTFTTIASPSDLEPNNTRATASPLAVNTTISGHTGYQYNGTRDDIDYYAITLPVDGKISFTISSGNIQNVYAQLFDNDGTTYIVGNYTSSTATYGANNLAAGTYYMLVHTFYITEFAPYTLSVSLEPMTFLAETAGDNSIAARGTLLPANTPTGGHLNFYYNLQYDNTDWWKIGYDGTGTMALHIDQEQNHFNTDYPYITYNLYLDTLLSPVASGQVHAATNTVNLSGLAVGIYYLRLDQAFATFGAYQLTASYTEKCANVVAINSSTQLAGCNGNITYGITGGLAPYSVQLYKDAIASGALQVVDNTNTITFTNLGVGTYYARSYSFGGSGICNNISSTTVFAIPATPIIGAGGATTFCQGGSITLTATAASSYLWSTGATTQSINVTATGNYTVTVYNAAGCASLVSATIAVTVNPLPAMPTISTGGGAITFCQGGSVTLTSSSASSYLWSTGATTQAITVSASGSYSVTVKNANGCSSPASAATVVTVNPLPTTPTIGAGGAITFCTGGSVTLTSSTATSYLWSSGATTQAIIVNASGSYTVVVKNANGCSSAASAATVVTVNPLPTVTLAAFTAVCSTDAAFALAGGSPAGGTYSGTGVSGGQFNPATAGVGTFTITYSYTNANNCTATAQQSITVNNCGGCTPTISTGGGAITFCQGGSVTLTSSAAAAYLWSTNETSQSITVNSSGNYSVTTTNTNNCTATSSVITVTVNPLPAIPTIGTSGPTTFCQGGSVTLTSSSATNNLWSTGATGQSIIASANGSYTVTVSNANNCTRTSAATIVTVNPLPAVPTIGTSGPTTFCQGGSVTLTSSSATNNLWSTGATGQSITASTNGNYIVTVSNANNCSASSAATTVTVNPLPTVALAAFAAVCNTNAVFALTGGSPAGGTYSGTGVNAGQFNPATAGVGTFTITYSYTNSNNCTATATNSITVNNCTAVCTATITPGGPITFCQGGSVTLTASAAATYLWSTNETSQSITVNSSGNYSVTTTNANNCTATSSIVAVTVNPLPAVPTIGTSGATTFCQGGSVTLTSSSATNNHWSTGATTQSIVVNATGDYSVTVTNANNCSTTSAVTSIKVNSLPATPAISASGATTFCLGGSVTLTSSSATNNHWSTGATTQSINVTSGGSYTVTVTNTNNCSSTSAATVVTVNNCNGTYCAANGSSKNKGYIANVFLRTIFNTTGYSAGGYGDYTNQSTSLNKRFNYVISVTPGYGSFLTAAPLYIRVWIDWNQDGDFNDPGELVFAPAGASFFLRLGVINPPNTALNGSTRMRVAVSATNVPTNCGSFAYGEVEDYTVVVGNGNWYRGEEPIDEPAITLSESFNLYPNPVSEELVIQKLTNDNSKVTATVTQMEITDMNGRTVVSSKLTRSTEVIDVRKLPAGIYVVRLRTGNTVTVRKIIVAH